MQIDERMIMFARMGLIEGSDTYNEFYTAHPELKEIDDVLRGMPNLCSEGTAMYNPLTAPIPDADFDIISTLHPLCEGEANSEQVPMTPEAATSLVKKLMKHYGADDVAITRLKEDHYYSVRGRQDYGARITKHHKYAIVFVKEMTKEMVNRAPRMDTVIETSKCYLNLGIMGLELSVYLRSIGYDTRNHMDGNYLVVAPLVARDAGLGQIGRHGLLLHPKYGGRIRLGVVTTDLELIPDEVKDMNLAEFCDVCGRCIKTCPGKAIPAKKSMINGVERYQIHQEECYRRWRSLGTDCGICLSNCPISQGVDLQLLEDKKYGEIIKTYTNEFPIRPIIREPYF